jgi:hypothetical protein
VTSTELVGPVPVVYFHGGPARFDTPRSALPKAAYVPPQNTLDPRYAACTHHRVACDCREAEMAEDRHEFWLAQKQLAEVAGQILAGHPTRGSVAGAKSCMCTGCQIVRAAGIWPRWEDAA